MDFTGVFSYNNDYLITQPQNIAIFAVVTIVFVVLVVVMRYTFLGFAGLYLLREEKKVLENRKKTLSDLILMKDIQTELEKEIEQATLKAAFQS